MDEVASVEQAATMDAGNGVVKDGGGIGKPDALPPWWDYPDANPVGTTPDAGGGVVVVPGGEGPVSDPPIIATGTTCPVIQAEHHDPLDPIYVDNPNCWPVTPEPPHWDTPVIWNLNPSEEALWQARHEPLPGLADLHIHQFAQYAYGANWFHGSATGPEQKALASCDGSTWVASGSDFNQAHVKVVWELFPGILTVSFTGGHVMTDVLKLMTKKAWEEAKFGCLQKWFGFIVGKDRWGALQCVGIDNFDNVAMHLFAGTHGSSKVPIYLAGAKMFGDDGPHDPSGWQKGYSGWPNHDTGSHQQVWEGWVREAHDRPAFNWYLMTYVYSGWMVNIKPSYRSYLSSLGYTDLSDAGVLLAAKEEFSGRGRGTNLNSYHNFVISARRDGWVGLNLMTTSAVDGVDLCSSQPLQQGTTALNDHDAETPQPWTAINNRWGMNLLLCGTHSVNLQLSAASAWAAANSSWVGLAHSSADARNIIAQGKMALLLSIEDSDIFWGDAFSQLKGDVSTLYRLDGVTALQMAHHLDNALSGVGFVDTGIVLEQAIRSKLGGGTPTLGGGKPESHVFATEVFNHKGPVSLIFDLSQRLFGKTQDNLITDLTNGLKMSGSFFWQAPHLVKSCRNVWLLGRVCIWVPSSGGPGVDLTANQTNKAERDQMLKDMLASVAIYGPICIDPLDPGAGPVNCMHSSVHTTAGGTSVVVNHENTRGLTASGVEVLKGQIAMGMPIDVSHLSNQAIRDIDQYLTDHGYCSYPMFASHALVRASLLHRGGGQVDQPMETKDAKRPGVEITNWEESERWMTPEILDILARRGGIVGLRTGPDATRTVFGPTPPANYQGTTWSFAQSQTFLWAKHINTAFGSDLNGFIAQAKPRCPSGVSSGCSWGSSSGAPLGSRFDSKGLASVQYLVDFWEDLYRLDTTFFGTTLRQETKNVKWATEAYLRMWERAELLKWAPNWHARGWSCADIHSLYLTPNINTLWQFKPEKNPIGASTAAPVKGGVTFTAGPLGSVSLPTTTPGPGGTASTSSVMLPLSTAVSLLSSHDAVDVYDPAAFAAALRTLVPPNFMRGYRYDAASGQMSQAETTDATYCSDFGVSQEPGYGCAAIAEGEAKAAAVRLEDVNDASRELPVGEAWDTCCFQQLCQSELSRCMDDDTCRTCLGDESSDSRCASDLYDSLNGCVATCTRPVDQGGCLEGNQGLDAEGQ